jgi:hypothetical protein
VDIEKKIEMHCIGGWMRPRAGLDAVEKKNSSCPCQEPNPESSAVQLVAYGAILALHFMSTPIYTALRIPNEV